MGKEDGEETSAKETVEQQATAEDIKTQKEIDRGETLISRANEAAERIEKGNEQMEINLARQERLKVEETLGGKTEAASKEKSPEDLEIEGARKLLEGTGFEDMAFQKEPKESS